MRCYRAHIKAITLRHVDFCDFTRLTAAVGQTPTRMVIKTQTHRVLPNLMWFKSVPRIITNVYKQL